MKEELILTANEFFAELSALKTKAQLEKNEKTESTTS